MLDPKNVKAKRKGILIFTFVFTMIIDGCFFPIINFNPANPVDFGGLTRMLLVAMGLRYHMSIGESEADLFPDFSPVVIGLINVAMVVCGMVCRFFLEFGEVSNTYNFTVLNVLFHVLVLAGASTIPYMLKRRRR